MKKYITFGEIMLRLKPPNWERFFQSPLLEATFGGGRQRYLTERVGSIFLVLLQLFPFRPQSFL